MPVPPLPPASPEKSKSGPGWIAVVAVVIALFIMMAGVVAAIVIPNFVNALHKAKAKRSLASMRALGTALEDYGTTTGGYPDTVSLDELLDAVDPERRLHEPVTDGWQNSIRYQCLELRDDICVSYAIQSGGKDGAFEILYEDSWARERRNEDFDCDLLFVDGRFIWYPWNGPVGSED